MSRISSGEDDLEKDGKDDDQKSSSEGGDHDNDFIQNTTDSKVGFLGIFISFIPADSPQWQANRAQIQNKCLKIILNCLKSSNILNTAEQIFLLNILAEL